MTPERSPIERGVLPLAQCPDAVWARAEIAVDRPRPRWHAWGWAAAAAILILAVAVTFRSRDAWIESGRIQIGTIGTVDVQPGSRVRVLKASASEHRLELAQGAIEAEINAPPRLFFVNTPAATAIDLGCKYRLETDAAGNGLLRVTGGWVAMGDALVPAGASCRIRAKRGAGTPLFDDAPAGLRTALDGFDENGRGLDAILATARVRDTLTLWHLLPKVQGADRERVLDRIASLTPVPAGVTREAVLALDEETLRKFREELVWTW
jgi:hypothetical protein